MSSSQSRACVASWANSWRNASWSSFEDVTAVGEEGRGPSDAGPSGVLMDTPYRRPRTAGACALSRAPPANPAPNLGSPAPTLRSPAPAVDHRRCSEASQSRRAGRVGLPRLVFITVDDQVARGRAIPAPLASDVRGMSTGGDHRTTAPRHDGERRRDAAPT